MKTAAPTHSHIFLLSLKGWLLSFHFLIFIITLLLLGVDANTANLFGYEAQATLASLLSFSPAHPFQLYGVTLATYPLVHSSWSHWLPTALLWLYLGQQLQKRFLGPKISRWPIWILFYGVAAVVISLIFLLPSIFAELLPIPALPFADSDRILGLSALTLFQLGALLCLRPPWTAWVLALVLAVILAVSPSSFLTHWGHAAGFILGLAVGAWLRSRSSDASAVFS